MISDKAIKNFQQSIENCHIKDFVSRAMTNPYKEGDISHLLYRKNWLDVVQWHYEDLIRAPLIKDSEEIARGIKIMKVYRQMKMYNDESLDPVLYQRKK